MKKTVLYLSVIVILAVLAIGLTPAVSADDTVVSGTWGSLSWELNQTTGHLTVSGNGTMNTFNFSGYNKTAWHPYKTSIKSITVMEGVTKIGDFAFYDCKNLTSVTLPNSVTGIGTSAFNLCSSLTSIAIPNSVVSIGASAFFNCTSLTSVTLPNTLTAINAYVFHQCSALTDITIPESVTSIGNSAFESCTGLDRITIPKNVTSIGKKAFSGCKSLTEIAIPMNVESIGEEAFASCPELTSISVDANNAFYHASEHCLIETKTKTLLLGCKNSVIPSDGSVTSIGKSAFANCKDLTSIVIPSDVISIGASAFFNCGSLTSVTLPENLASIGNSAFYECRTLESITIPNSVTIIGEYAFGGCKALTEITIPNGVVHIASYVFFNCPKLTSVVIPGSVTTIGGNVFNTCASLQSVIYCGTAEKWEALNQSAGIDTSIVSFHQYQWRSIDAEAHGNVCIFCESVTEASPHTWSSGEIIAQPTHLAVGIRLYTCPGCNGNKTEEIAKLPGHTYADKWVPHNDSQHKKPCECGDAIYDFHSWDIGVVTKKPTHLEAGVKTYTCYDCGATATEEIARLAGHTYGEWTKHNETQHKRTCECGDMEYHGHAWNTGVITTDPTHLEAGVKTYTCTECGESKTEEIAKLAEHTYGDWVIVKSPTVDEEGLREKACICGDKITESIAKLTPPAQTTAPADTTEGTPNQTEAPADTTGNEITQTTAAKTTASTNKTSKANGCSGTALGSLSVLVLLLPAACVLWKKKK
ncbi:MAG: leucine-rich repeat protein [Clostridia bacterium]|nr:leucine-rich repeat protein [Clostridia bacterium]